MLALKSSSRVVCFPPWGKQVSGAPILQKHVYFNILIFFPRKYLEMMQSH